MNNEIELRYLLVVYDLQLPTKIGTSKYIYRLLVKGYKEMIEGSTHFMNTLIEPN